MTGPGAGDEFDAYVAMFERVIARSPVAILLLRARSDGTAQVVAANPAAEALLARNDLPGLDLRKITTTTGRPLDSETVRRAADGRVDVVARVRPYQRGDGTSVLLTGFALTLRHEAGGSLNAMCLVERERADWARRLIGHDAQVTAAMAEIRGALLRGDPIEDVLAFVCDSTQELMQADSTGLLEVVGDTVLLRAGDRASARPDGTRWPVPQGEFGEALRERRLMRGSSDGARLVADDGRRVLPEIGDDEFHMAIAPVESSDGSGFGVLTVRRRSAPFTEEMLGVLEAFAQGLAETLSVAAGRAELERLRVLEVRQGIARDLHDEVIQDLIGLRLQMVGLVPKVEDPELARSLEDVRDELNRTTMRLRDVVAGLQEQPAGHFEDSVRALTGSRAERQGLHWTAAVDGPVDDLAGDVRADVLRVLNESVSNVLRHAHATRVDVRLAVTSGRVELTVTDDGVGPDGATAGPGMGLDNLRTRAYDRGGECSLGSGPDGGSVLTWWVPVPPPEAGPDVPLPAP